MVNNSNTSQSQIARLIAEQFPESELLINTDDDGVSYEIHYCGAQLITLGSQWATFSFPVRGSSQKSWHSFEEGDPQAIADSFLRDLADAGFLTLNSRGAVNAKRRVWIGKYSRCPNCSYVGAIKEFRYGMPGEDFNHKRFLVGGCVIEDEAPEIACTQCNWSGAKEVLRFRN